MHRERSQAAGQEVPEEEGRTQEGKGRIRALGGPDSACRVRVQGAHPGDAQARARQGREACREACRARPAASSAAAPGSGELGRRALRPLGREATGGCRCGLPAQRHERGWLLRRGARRRPRQGECAGADAHAELGAARLLPPRREPARGDHLGQEGAREKLCRTEGRGGDTPNAGGRFRTRSSTSRRPLSTSSALLSASRPRTTRSKSRC